MKKILVTGAAGFIGFHLCEMLVKQGVFVLGLDNINAYYDINLKYSRLKELGIEKEKASVYNQEVESTLYDCFRFVKMDLQNREELPKLFDKHQFTHVINLAAQAGVRYSIENPSIYIDSNIVGFSNIIECAKMHSIEHFIYASSSSVYGLTENIPFSTSQNVDSPVSLYAATKKSNELIAHTYSHLFQMKTTGLRFFTVYGPWGRPDMAMFLFTNAIVKDEEIKVFNNGNLERDFTYIDDIVNGLSLVLNSNVKEREEFYKLYNIGNNKSVKLLDFISEIEKNLNKEGTKKLMPMQPGDVKKTWANIDQMMSDYNYHPKTTIEEGVKKFIEWYKSYYI